MSGDEQNLPQRNRGLAFADQIGRRGYSPDSRISSFFSQNVDFQPTQDCPRNFVIFDRTDNRSQIMYHPATTSDFCYRGLTKDAGDPRVVTNEDLEDIDALLSFEDEDEEEYEDDDVSTARMEGNDAGSVSDTCSSRPRNVGQGSSSESEQKREKMKKMVKSLKGMVPGGNRRMKTADVLDDAVKYLKTLKVEAQKMGVGDLSI